MRNFFRDMVDMGVDVELDSNDFDRVGAADEAKPALPAQAQAPAAFTANEPAAEPARGREEA